MANPRVWNACPIENSIRLSMTSCQFNEVHTALPDLDIRYTRLMVEHVPTMEAKENVLSKNAALVCVKPMSLVIKIK